MIKSWLFLICAILFNTIGNVLMKKFSLALNGSTGLMNYLTPTFLIGGAFFGINLMLYSKALEFVPLSVAYPILVAVSLFLVTLVSVVLFGEKLSTVQVLGLVMVGFGVFLINFGLNNQ